MTTTQLKNQLVKKINGIEDKKRLKFIKEMIELDEDIEEPYILNDVQRKLIKQSERDFKEGKYRSHEDVMKDIKKWLKEK